MGAAESTTAPPQSPRAPESPNLLSPGRPLYALLNPVHNLPSDPDSPFYTALFREYTLFHRQSSKPLSSLTSAALDLPAGPHAVALVASLRSAVHRLRTDQEAPLLGALLLSTSALADLRRAAPDDPVCLVLGAGIAERSLCPTDRIDLGRSLVARLITAALHILCGNEVSVTSDIAIAAIDLLLVALADELYVIPGETEPLSRLLDRYPVPSAVVLSLLQILVDAAPHTDPDQLLKLGTENVVQYDRSFRRSSGLASVTASASALALQSGFTDAFNALSARFPFVSFVNSQTFLQQPTSPNLSTSEAVHIPDLHSDPYAPYGPSTPLLQSRSPLQSPMPDSSQLGPAHNLLGASHGSTRSPTVKWGEKEQANGYTFMKRLSSSQDAGTSGGERGRMQLAERALVLLAIICGPRVGNPYRQALVELQNKPPRSASEKDNWYPFSKLYEALGRWVLHPNGALITYYLFTGNRRFRAFALSRTDPELFLVPLLGSLRRRCSVGAVAADAYIPAAIMLIMTSDRGFCEAIDEISVVPSWLRYIEDTNRLGNEHIMLSGLMILVCARAVQQSLVIRRREADCFLASLCLGVMGNVSGNVSNLHSVAADRLLSLVEFLGRRRRKAILLSQKRTEFEANETNNGSSERQIVGGESRELREELEEFIGLCLEIITTVLRSRSSVSANRHLVYTLLHRETILDSEYITNGSEQARALGHMLRRVVSLFSKHIDESAEGNLKNRSRKGGQSGLGMGAGSMSVEKVFDVIEKKARHIPGDVFDGTREMRFTYEEGDLAEDFLRTYYWSLSTRLFEMFWNVDKAVVPIGLACFKP